LSDAAFSATRPASAHVPDVLEVVHRGRRGARDLLLHRVVMVVTSMKSKSPPEADRPVAVVSVVPKVMTSKVPELKVS
jgi:hypothetical protein